MLPTADQIVEPILSNVAQYATQSLTQAHLTQLLFQPLSILKDCYDAIVKEQKIEPKYFITPFIILAGITAGIVVPLTANSYVDFMTRTFTFLVPRGFFLIIISIWLFTYIPGNLSLFIFDISDVIIKGHEKLYLTKARLLELENASGIPRIEIDRIFKWIRTKYTARAEPKWADFRQVLIAFMSGDPLEVIDFYNRYNGLYQAKLLQNGTMVILSNDHLMEFLALSYRVRRNEIAEVLKFIGDRINEDHDGIVLDGKTWAEILGLMLRGSLAGALLFTEVQKNYLSTLRKVIIAHNENKIVLDTLLKLQKERDSPRIPAASLQTSQPEPPSPAARIQPAEPQAATPQDEQRRLELPPLTVVPNPQLSTEPAPSQPAPPPQPIHEEDVVSSATVVAGLQMEDLETVAAVALFGNQGNEYDEETPLRAVTNEELKSLITLYSAQVDSLATTVARLEKQPHVPPATMEPLSNGLERTPISMIRNISASNRGSPRTTHHTLSGRDPAHEPLLYYHTATERERRRRASTSDLMRSRMQQTAAAPNPNVASTAQNRTNIQPTYLV